MSFHPNFSIVPGVLAKFNQYPELPDNVLADLLNQQNLAFVSEPQSVPVSRDDIGKILKAPLSTQDRSSYLSNIYDASIDFTLSRATRAVAQDAYLILSIGNEPINYLENDNAAYLNELLDDLIAISTVERPLLDLTTKGAIIALGAVSTTIFVSWTQKWNLDNPNARIINPLDGFTEDYLSASTVGAYRLG